MEEHSIKYSRIPGKIVVIGVIVIAAIAVLAGSTGVVGDGQRGVLLRFSAVTGEIKGEGIYFKIPFIEEVILMSTNIQKYTTPVSSSSKDLQVVATEVTLNYQLQEAKVGEIYSTMRQSYENILIQPFIQEAVKSTTANYAAEELITLKPQVRSDIRAMVAERLAPLGIDVVELSLYFQFTPAFQESIEAKRRAERPD